MHVLGVYLSDTSMRDGRLLWPALPLHRGSHMCSFACDREPKSKNRRPYHDALRRSTSTTVVPVFMALSFLTRNDGRSKCQKLASLSHRENYDPSSFNVQPLSAR